MMKKCSHIDPWKKVNRFSLFATMMFFILILYRTADGGVEEPQVRDIIKKWHFTGILDMYSDGQKNLLLVGTENDQLAFWNPADDTLSPPLDEGCKKNLSACTNGLHHLKTLVTNKPIEGVKPVPWDTSFGGGAMIYMHTEYPQPSFTHYYTVQNRDGSTDNFYIICRRMKPSRYHGSRGEVTREHKIYQTFDAVPFLCSTDIGNGRTLLYAGSDELYPVLIELTTIPKSIWSADGNVFLVPTEILAPRLKEAGNNWRARYNAVLRVIGEDSVQGPMPTREEITHSNPELLALESKMNEAYSKAFVLLSEDGKKILADGQNGWARFVDSAVLGGKIHSVEIKLARTYKERIEDLDLAALQKGPYLFSRVDTFATKEADDITGRYPGVEYRRLSYPRIDSPLTPAIAQWNALMAQNAGNASHYNNPEGDFGDLDLSFKINAAFPNLISVRFDFSWYYHGTPHGGYGPWNSTILLTENLIKELKPEDLFGSEQTKASPATQSVTEQQSSARPEIRSETSSQDVVETYIKLKKKTRARGTHAPLEPWGQFLAKHCADELTRIAQEQGENEEVPAERTAAIVSDVRSWTITESGLSITFPPYSVLSYAFGTHDIAIPWSELKPFLVENAPIPK
jgi:hypothetical protein